jgi:DNA-binding response OmpR family regulator
MDQNKYPYTILFIDDEDIIRENYLSYLKLLFKEVYSAKDSYEGYKIYNDKKPDIMIVDIKLPHISGLELVRKIREKDFQTKVIMLTAHSDKNYLLEATELKLSQYLIKPVTRAQLQKTLQKTIDELLLYSVEPLKIIDLSNNYYWDIKKEKLMYFSTEVYLTTKEKEFISLLSSSLDRVFTYDEIIENIWSCDENVSIESIKTLVKKIRKKLPFEAIENVFSQVYKLKQRN